MLLLSKNKRHTIIYLIIANFLLYFGFRSWQAMLNNFAVEEIGIGPASMGWLQAVRELPGLMGFLLGFLVLIFSEIKIMAICIIMLGGGIFLTGQANNAPYLFFSTLVMSFGFHFFYSSNNSVVLMTLKKEEAPKFMGQLNSLGAIAALAATGAVYFLTQSWGYKNLYMAIGGFVAAGGVFLLLFKDGQESLPSRRKILLRWQYWLYYLLSFLMGCRRHIFTTFAIFLLVKEYGISVQTTALLFLVNSVVSVYTLQSIGKLVHRLGERLMLTIAFSILIIVFLGYAFVTYLPILFILFVVDNVLFGVSMALTTYFHKIAVTQEEITSNVAVQQTINHIAAIVVPIIGGIVWKSYGSQTPFLVGVGIVTVSLFLVQFMHLPLDSETAPALANLKKKA